MSCHHPRVPPTLGKVGSHCSRQYKSSAFFSVSQLCAPFLILTYSLFHSNHQSPLFQHGSIKASSLAEFLLHLLQNYSTPLHHLQSIAVAANSEKIWYELNDISIEKSRQWPTMDYSSLEFGISNVFRIHDIPSELIKSPDCCEVDFTSM